MAMATPSSPFGPLQLSCTDTVWLQDLVRLLVHDHVLSYEKYALQDQRRLDPSQWKRNMQRDNLHVYSQFSTTQQRIPTLLLVGTIKGSLDDVMYGVLNPTANSMRVKSSYVGDKFANCAVLATLKRPTASDPFRSHTLKWFEGDHPSIFRPIVKNRDFVFMEATGFAELATANRERVGYHVMHSVTFPGARAMNGNIRAHMAVCAFYRQQSDRVVEVFTKTTANPGGHIAPAITVKYAATALLSAQNLVHCAYAKKLAWAVARQTRSTSTTSSSSSSSSTQSSHTREFRLDGVCINCAGNISLFSRSDVCAHCARPICSACKVKQSLSFVSWTGALTKHKMRFCGSAVLRLMRCRRNASRLSCSCFRGIRSGSTRPSPLES